MIEQLEDRFWCSDFYEDWGIACECCSSCHDDEELGFQTSEITVIVEDFWFRTYNVCCGIMHLWDDDKDLDRLPPPPTATRSPITALDHAYRWPVRLEFSIEEMSGVMMHRCRATFPDWEDEYLDGEGNDAGKAVERARRALANELEYYMIGDQPMPTPKMGAPV